MRQALVCAQASMLQCPQLADSCLALGQASCRRARELTHQYATQGVLPYLNMTPQERVGLDRIAIAMILTFKVSLAISLSRPPDCL